MNMSEITQKQTDEAKNTKTQNEKINQKINILLSSKTESVVIWVLKFRDSEIISFIIIFNSLLSLFINFLIFAQHFGAETCF